MNKKELQEKVIEMNIENIKKSENFIEVVKRDDEKGIAIVKEWDDCMYNGSPLDWLEFWKTELDNGYNALVYLLGDHINNIYDNNNNTKDFFDDVIKYAYRQGIVLIPITKYEHTGVSYSVGIENTWDSGVSGFAWYNRKEVTNNGRLTARKREQMLDKLVNSLDYHNQWCNGEVYNVSTYDTIEGELLDNVGGIFNEDDTKDFVEEAMDNFVK